VSSDIFAAIGRLTPEALVCLCLVGCGNSTAPTDSIDGTYVLQWTGHAAICAPATLPAPAGSEASRYFVPPARDSSRLIQLAVTRTDTAILLTIVSASGGPDDAGPYVQTSATGPGVAMRTRGPISEGPRVGNHTFSATETTRFDFHIGSLFLLPPGGSQSNVHIVSSTTYTFRDGGPAGPIFTSCVAHDTADGSRYSP